MVRLLLLLGLIAATPAAAGASDMVVEGYLSPCQGEALMLCKQVDGGYFYSVIAGFEFVWGERVVAEVEVSSVDDPPADGSSLSYQLIREVSREAVPPGTAFSWHVPANLVRMGFTPPLDAKTMTLMGGKAFTCSKKSTCKLLKRGMRDESALKVDFAFGDPATGPLVVTAVEVVPGR